MKSKLNCMICDQASNNVYELEQHFKNHDPSEIRRFSCHLCSLKFLKISTLEKHLLLVHLKKSLSEFNRHSYELRSLRLEVKLAIDKVRQDNDEPGENESLDLPLDEIREIDIDFDITPADKPEVSPQLEKDMKPKTYTCPVDGCAKSFRHLTSFIMHEKCVHSEIRSFTCEICSKSFKTSSNFNVHVKIHKNQRDHQCNMCSQSFFTSSHLKAHIKVHLNEPSFKCDVPECGKTFIHSSSFKKHKAYHSGEKSHQCGICQRTFSQACHLRQHLKIHSNERNHVCGQCGKAFARPDTLRIHERTHATQSP